MNKPIVLFTQHSVTTEFEYAAEQVLESLEAIKNLAKNGVQIIVTYPNNDAGGKIIIEKLLELDNQSLNNIQVHRSLGRYLYHGILALARDNERKVVCVGNSSSGVKETPVFGCPTVNIGSRQLGRLRGQNVIDVEYNARSIFDLVMKCIKDKDFRLDCQKADNPYYLGNAVVKIAEVLASIPINEQLLRKKMKLKGEVKDGWVR